MAGQYTLITPPEAIAAAQQAELDQALANVPAMLRPLGERLLRPTFFYCSRYQIEVGASFRLQCDDRPVLERALDGSASTMSYDGQTLQSSIQHSDTALTLALQSDKGARTTSFVPTADGLTVTIEVSSSHLDAPLRWQLQYRRL